VQNALVQISLAGSPSAAIMSTNLTRFVTDLGEVLPGAEAYDRSESRVSGMAHRGAIAGFVAGCGLGVWRRASAFGACVPSGSGNGQLARLREAVSNSADITSAVNLGHPMASASGFVSASHRMNSPFIA
jgi:hypothetical protein